MHRASVLPNEEVRETAPELENNVIRDMAAAAVESVAEQSAAEEEEENIDGQQMKKEMHTASGLSQQQIAELPSSQQQLAEMHAASPGIPPSAETNSPADTAAATAVHVLEEVALNKYAIQVNGTNHFDGNICNEYRVRASTCERGVSLWMAQQHDGNPAIKYVLLDKGHFTLQEVCAWWDANRQQYVGGNDAPAHLD